MNRIMRFGPFLAGAIIVLGGQGCKDASDPPQHEATVAAEPDAPQAGADDSAESEDSSGSPMDDKKLISRVQGLMQMKSVVKNDVGIKITYPLNASPVVDEKSPPSAVTDAMMTAIFYTLPHLYDARPPVEGFDHLEMVFMYNADTIGTVNTTRSSYESLGYKAMKGEDAERDVQRKFLRQLPRRDVKINRKYRP